MTMMEGTEVVEMITSTKLQRMSTKNEEAKKRQSRSCEEFRRLEYLSRCICYTSSTKFIYN
jgi:hypothetical protein